MNQALIVTDSLGAPRKNPFTLYQDTWVSYVEDYLLKQHDMKTFAYTQTGLTSKGACKQAAIQLQYYKPDIVIIQLGIVDCTPRLFKYTTLQQIEPFVPDFCKKIYKKFSKFILVDPKLSKFRKRHDVSPDEFITNLEVLFNNYFKQSIIVFIPIGTPNKRYIFDSKYVKDFVTKYNDILKSFSGDRFIYLESIEKLVKTNIHKIYDKKNRHYLINGHKLIADTIIDELEVLQKQFPRFKFSGDGAIKYEEKINLINDIVLKTVKDKKLFIFGSGGYAKALWHLFSQDSRLTVTAFIEKNPTKDFLCGLNVIDESSIKDIVSGVVFIASADADTIYRRLKRYQNDGMLLIKAPKFFKKNKINFNATGYHYE